MKSKYASFGHQVISYALTWKWKAVKSRWFHHTVEEVCKLRLTKNGSCTLFPACARRKKVTHPNKFRDSNIWTFPKDVLLVDISGSIQYPQDSSIVQPNRPCGIDMVRIYRSLTFWYKSVHFHFSSTNRKPSAAANFCALKFTNLLYSLVESPYLHNLWFPSPIYLAYEACILTLLAFKRRTLSQLQVQQKQKKKALAQHTITFTWVQASACRIIYYVHSDEQLAPFPGLSPVIFIHLTYSMQNWSGQKLKAINKGLGMRLTGRINLGAYSPREIWCSEIASEATFGLQIFALVMT